MIQRIQSVYLLVVVLLHVLLFFAPVISVMNTIATPNAISTAHNLGLLPDGYADAELSGGPMFSTWQMLALVMNLLAAAVAGAAIFMYNSRKRQARLAALGTVMELLLAIFFFLMYYEVMEGSAEGDGRGPGFGWGFFVPLVATILLVLARMRILADERLVRSVDRLR